MLNDLQHMPSSTKKHHKSTAPESRRTTKMFSFFLSDRLFKNSVTLWQWFLHKAAAFLARNDWICYKGWAGKITWTGDKWYTLYTYSKRGLFFYKILIVVRTAVTHKLSEFPSFVATSIVAVLRPQGMHYSIISWNHANTYSLQLRWLRKWLK